ncbi:MAG: GPW/gp25 family protein [Peptococcaceae bacterium]|jgi:phage baseplate assembly protein W|nr:GPW/gp25 family protein [Peptococcaceae bacterium]
MAQRNRSASGSGWKFPVETDPMTGRVKMSDYDEDIQESIRIILLTRKGERVMNPEFGCGIHDFAFSQMETTRIGMLEKEIQTALTLWEPRVQDVDVAVTQDAQAADKYLIQIRYVVLATGQAFSLIYPFYVY